MYISYITEICAGNTPQLSREQSRLYSRSIQTVLIDALLKQNAHERPSAADLLAHQFVRDSIGTHSTQYVVAHTNSI